MIQTLTLKTYLIHIREIILDGTGQYPDYVYKHLEDVMMDIFLCYSCVVEDRYPETDEISVHLNLPESIEALRNLTTLCVNSTLDTWPDVMNRLQSMLPGTNLSKIDWDTEERRQNAGK